MKELSRRILDPKPCTQKQVLGLAGVDEFYYGLTHEGQENPFRASSTFSRNSFNTIA